MSFHPNILFDPLAANRRLKWALVISSVLALTNIVVVVQWDAETRGSEAENCSQTNFADYRGV